MYNESADKAMRQVIQAQSETKGVVAAAPHQAPSFGQLVNSQPGAAGYGTQSRGHS